jgi:hypothetical protein
VLVLVLLPTCEDGKGCFYAGEVISWRLLLAIHNLVTGPRQSKVRAAFRAVIKHVQFINRLGAHSLHTTSTHR